MIRQKLAAELVADCFPCGRNPKFVAFWLLQHGGGDFLVVSQWIWVSLAAWCRQVSDTEWGM